MGTLAPSPEIQQDRQPNSLYERDFYSWSIKQAEALKRRDFNAIDWENVSEEIKDLGLGQRNEWRNYCARAIQHLLKIQYWDYPHKGVLLHWEAEVMVFRQHMAILIAANPGMKGRYAQSFADAWKLGRSMAVKSFQDYDIKYRPAAAKNTYRNWDRLLPEKCPYRLEHVAACDPETDQEPRKDIWPPSVAGILNSQVERNHPILPNYTWRRSPSRSGGWSR